MTGCVCFLLSNEILIFISHTCFQKILALSLAFPKSSYGIKMLADDSPFFIAVSDISRSAILFRSFSPCAITNYLPMFICPREAAGSREFRP